MDALVEAALRKWPNVPHCHGWLALDARGHWFMRDERIQRAGSFPQVKGSRIDHPRLLAFIERNYGCDPAGQWFFQNGPQRVYVELECAPWVWRIEAAAGFALTSHTGRAAQPRSCLLGDDGRVYLDTDIGFGLVHTLDMEAAADAIEQGHWAPEPLCLADAPARFGFRLRPEPAAR